MSRDEVHRVLEGVSDHTTGSSEDFRRVCFTVVHSSRPPGVDMGVERRDNRIVQRERDVKEPLHRSGEREDAVPVYLQR